MLGQIKTVCEASLAEAHKHGGIVRTQGEAAVAAAEEVVAIEPWRRAPVAGGGEGE